MNFDEQASFLAQTHAGELLREGIVQSAEFAIGVDPKQGLIVFAQGWVGEAGDAFRAVEIMLDDMQMNLTSMHSQTAGWELSSASTCLSESLDNINGYLYDHYVLDPSELANAPGLSLCALQLMSDHFSIIPSADFHCLRLRQGKFEPLAGPGQADQAIGLQAGIAVKPAQHAVQQGDLIMLMPAADFLAIGADFLRITLSRFSEHAEMAIRQINTRAARLEMAHKPLLAIITVDKMAPQKQGWLGRFTKG